MHHSYLLISLTLLSLVTSPTLALSPQKAAARPGVPTARAIRLQVVPPSVKLNGPLAVQRLLVTATLTDGSQQDVTDSARFTAASPSLFAVANGEITPRRDGTTAVRVTYGKLQATVPVSIQGAGAQPEYSFVNDVIPTLSRLGCNSGPCHGGAQGKGGFRLSLRGYAPELDYFAITRHLGGRRIARTAPERSLLLRKPLLEVAHRGGKRLQRGSREYEVLLGWLRHGSQAPTGKEPTLAKLEVTPGNRKVRPGDRQRLVVRALFTDGHAEDVTHRAIFSTNDLAIATVDEGGLVTQQRSGETAVIARYMDKLTAVRFMAPFDQKVNPAAFTARGNYIDDLVNAKLKELRIEPSGLCTDEEFLRRAYVDAIGTLPTVEEARAFLDDRDPKKRDKLVDALLQRPEYGMVWALKLGDLFTLRREYMQRKNAMVLQQWLMEQFNENRPWDQLATDILTAAGDIDTHRGGLFYVSRAPQKPGEGYWIRATENTSEMIAQVFLGNRIQCAKCHNHPTERYTQDDYYHFAALWQQVSGKEGPGPVPLKLTATASGDVRQPRTNELMAPRPLDRADLGFTKDEDRRLKAAAWIVKQDDFARNIVNRVWARCFGAGIVEPVDDVRSTNPATNEPLMRALCADLRAHNFDLKYLTATILKSRTYQLGAQPNKTNRTDTKLFSHYPARRLPAEELADAVAQVTGVPDRYQGLPAGIRACELADTEIPSIMLDTFGRPPRVMPSDSERNCNPAISQALALLNSDAIQQKLKSPECVLTELLKKPDAEALETLFLSALARRPTAKEQAALLEQVKQSPKRDEAFQDVLWALLNSKEFMFNH